jgi:microsomal epoxide hydrolase
MATTSLPIISSPSRPFSSLPSPLKAPTPFKLSIPDSQLDEFKTLLKVSKIPAPTYESLQSDGRFGVSHEWMTAAKARWESGFDWRKCEERINSFPGFMSKVEVGYGDGGDEGQEEFDVHWAGLLSEKEDAVPILLLHGWPG